MRGIRLAGSVLGLLCVAALPAARAQTLESQHWQLFDEYCSDCHNLDDYAGGFALDLLTRDDVPQDAEAWEKVIRKLRSGMMPPPGQPRPARAEVLAATGNIEQVIDSHAALNPVAGAPLLHRMNRTEYANAIRDLLGFTVNPAELMPADDASAGFDNIAAALNVSSTLMQSWVTAAARISRLAIGDLTSSAGSVNFQPPSGVDQGVHIDGLPLGTRGGLVFEHVFPLDADYSFNIRRLGANNFNLPAVGLAEAIEIVIDGEQVAVLPPDQPPRLTLPVSAGPHRVQIAFLHTQPEQEVDDLYAVHASSASIAGVELNGPLNVRGAGNTPGRARVFICQPRESSEEEPCARRIVEHLAERAWRGPVEADAIALLLQFYRDGAALRGFETGVQYALARILVDPRFVYRFEQEPAGLAPGTAYALGDFELASRLAFFLWSSIPDDTLLQLAAEGRLQDAAVLREQAARMLQDPRADALVDNFATQWLGLRALATINPVTAAYDGTLRESMQRETRLLFASVLRDARPVTTLLDADYTYVDERLARHYGITDVKGSRFRRIEVTDPARHGLLGHASILTLTSAPNRTSPVKRGQWILENLLGSPPPPPPPGVETNLEEAVGATAPTTIRQRLEQHRADPSCSACHAVIDPMGFALENFDEIGQWRATLNGAPVDTTAPLWDGSMLDGPQSLRAFLLQHEQDFVLTFSEKLLAYALGRKLEYHDLPQLRAIVREAGAADHTLQALVAGIVGSDVFRLRQAATVSELAAE